MLACDITQSYVLDRQVQDVVRFAGDQPLQGGLAPETGQAWILAHQQLAVWKYASLEGGPRILRVPYASRGALHVQLLAQPTASALSIVAASPEGQLAVWLDAHHSAPPLTCNLEAGMAPGIAAGAAGSASGGGTSSTSGLACLQSLPLDSSTGPGFVAVAGMADGSLQLLQASVRWCLHAVALAVSRLPLSVQNDFLARSTFPNNHS